MDVRMGDFNLLFPFGHDLFFSIVRAPSPSTKWSNCEQVKFTGYNYQRIVYFSGNSKPLWSVSIKTLNQKRKSDSHRLLASEHLISMVWSKVKRREVRKYREASFKTKSGGQKGEPSCTTPYQSQTITGKIVDSKLQQEETHLVNPYALPLQQEKERFSSLSGNSANEKLSSPPWILAFLYWTFVQNNSFQDPLPRPTPAPIK